MSGHQDTVRIAVVNDYEIVVAGVVTMLRPFAQIRVVETVSSLPVVSRDVDIVLFDTFGAVGGQGVEVRDLVRRCEAKVVVFSWNIDPDVVRQAIAQGASGYLSKALSGSEVVLALKAICRGEVVVPEGAASRGPEGSGAAGGWPGKAQGLTAREAEVISLITQGLTNQEIADHSYLSINSVKTYIRTAYRKMGVSRRSQAVVWGIGNGFLPDESRTLRPASG